MLVTTVSLVLGTALQLVLLRALAPTALVGDENEYAATVPPGAGALWVRVPLHRAVLRTAQRIAPPGHGLVAARLAVSAQAILALGLATGWAECHLGTGPAVLVAGLMLLTLERAILALHLWPDTAIGLAWLTAALLMWQDGPGAAAALALAGGLALGLRIEGAAICAVAVTLPLLRGDLSDAALAAAICAGFATLYAVWNGLRTGHWVLDSTLGFNLTVARIDAANPDNSVRETMQGAIRQARAPAKGGLPPTRPHVHARRLLARLNALLGRESFVTQSLLQTGAAGYAGPWHPARLAMLNLRHGFSLVAALTLLLSPFADRQHVALLGLAATIYALLLVRSRYRMAMLPLMALVTAQGAQGAATSGTPAQWAIGLVLLGLFTALTTTAPRIDEVRQTG